MAVRTRRAIFTYSNRKKVVVKVQVSISSSLCQFIPIMTKTL